VTRSTSPSVPLMPDVAYIVKLTAADGKRDEAIAALGRLVDATESEPGTLQYVFYADSTDPSAIWFTELYADEAAFNAHMSSATMAEVVGSLGGLLGGPADMRRVEIFKRKGGDAAG
jgi:(4S)-4-hydroxy-5-phosphonooxypentane-2,3-dione isomerase